MNSPDRVDRLVILVVSGSQADALMRRLRQERFYFTVIDSTGGMLQEPTVCLLLGFSQGRLPALLEIVRQNCQPRTLYVPAQMRMPGDMGNLPMVEAQVGGALVYSLNVEQFVQL
jgi:uncharacterized protein YaaQ